MMGMSMSMIAMISSLSRVPLKPSSVEKSEIKLPLIQLVHVNENVNVNQSKNNVHATLTRVVYMSIVVFYMI